MTDPVNLQAEQAEQQRQEALDRLYQRQWAYDHAVALYADSQLPPGAAGVGQLKAILQTANKIYKWVSK